MAIARYFGLYALARGALYFLVGANVVIYGIGGIATGAFDGLGATAFGVLYLTVAFALFLAGGLLTMERKIGRLLAVVVLSVDAAWQGFEALAAGSGFSMVFAACSAGTVLYLLVRNPLASGERSGIDEESDAHDIGVEEF
jgi:hypothetical protein